MEYKVTLKSKSEDIKWPRYKIQLDQNLSFKEATNHTYAALREKENQRLLLSQFKYDKTTGIVDTRVNRENE